MVGIGISFFALLRVAGILFLVCAPLSPAIADSDFGLETPTETSSGVSITINDNTEESAIPDEESPRDPKSMSWSQAFDELFIVMQSVRDFDSPDPDADSNSSFPGNGLLQKAKKVQELSSRFSNLKTNRIVHTAMTISANEKVIRGLKGMSARPNKLHLIYYQLAAIVLLMFFKNWQLSRLEKGQFGKRCFIEFQSMFLFMGVTILVVPLLFYGRDYANVLRGLGSVLGAA